jgi:uncharacterized repeat protein (TIGR03803 family)
MKGKIPLAALFALLASSAFAAGSHPVAVHAFICKGSPQQRVGPCPRGADPYSVFQGSDGNFYGNTQVSSEGESENGGTVFSITPSGKISTLHKFLPGADGRYDNGDNPGLLVEGPDGKLYGTALNGGVGNGVRGDGLLFRLNRDGSGFQVIHKFCSETNCTDGVGPQGLILGGDGNLYGTTFGGGTGSCGGGGCGAIFRVTPSSGAYQVAFNFNGTTDGYEPSAIVLAPNGSLYGNSGVTFEYTPSTGYFQVLPVKFPLINGAPSLGVVSIVGPNGNLYGLYFVAGMDGVGLFEVETDGNNLQLFPFYNTYPGGGTPENMILASDGNFWNTDYNGRTGYGDIISVSPSTGALLQTLELFGTEGVIGAYPTGIIQAKSGTLWGSTGDFGNYTNGHFAAGTVFKLNAGLPPRK